MFTNTGVRELGAVVDVLATPDQTLEAIIADVGTRQSIIDTGEPSMIGGIEQREKWLRDQVAVYDDLIFNFENSLGVAIARLRQIDALHQDPYFKRSAYPYTSYGNVDLYTYAFDTAYIENQIASRGPDQVELVRARQAAVRRMRELHAREQALIQQLTIARNSHLSDVQALDNFYAGLLAHYTGLWSLNPVFQDVADVTGRRMKTMYDAWNDLVPDITYYYLGDGSWIQTEARLSTNLFGVEIGASTSAYGRISGKTGTYFELYDLYATMKHGKAAIMALGPDDFDAWMAATTIARDTYDSLLRTEGVYGPDWPCWQVLLAVQHLQEAINQEYRYQNVIPTYHWAVQGRLGTDGSGPAGRSAEASGGIGLGDVDLIIDGHWGEDASGAHVTFPVTTSIDGTFLFEFLSTGNFTISGSAGSPTGAEQRVALSGGEPTAYLVDPVPLAVRDGDVTVEMTATPTPEAGNIIAGVLQAAGDQALGGQTVVIESCETGEVAGTLSLADGTFVFTGLAAGSYTVRPAEAGLEGVPDFQPVTVPPSATHLAIVLHDEPYEVPGDLNDNNLQDVADVIAMLQVLAGRDTDVPAHLADVDANGRMGLPDACWMLQKVSGQR